MPAALVAVAVHLISAIVGAGVSVCCNGQTEMSVAQFVSALLTRCSFCAAHTIECGADDAAGVARAFTAGVKTRYIWML